MKIDIFHNLACIFKVKELEKLQVPALAYCKETLTEARKAGWKIAIKIKECRKWDVDFILAWVVVSPTIEPNWLRLHFTSMWDWQAKWNAPSGMAKYPLA